MTASGGARMVDVGAKAETERVAVARGRVRMRRATLERILAGAAEKGDVLGVARLAGIMAAKRTPDILPLCHPLTLTAIDIDLVPERSEVRGSSAAHAASGPAAPLGRSGSGVSAALAVTARVACRGRTGVEMEALTAVAAACLTVYDMCKTYDRGMQIGPIELLAKSGGRSGAWRRAEDGAAPPRRRR